MKPSRSFTLTALLAWLAGAVTAVAVGLLALSSIDFGLGSHAPALPLGDVSTPDSPQPSASAPASPPEGTSASPSVAPAGVDKTITSRGGTVVARCTTTGAYLVSWSPAQGFRADDVRRGPTATVRAEFEGTTGKYVITVTCANGIPQGTVRSGDR